MSIESRNIKKDLELFSDGFKVGEKDLGIFIEKLAPVIDEAYSVMSKYMDNSSEKNNDISNKNVIVNDTNIFSVEENI